MLPSAKSSREGSPRSPRALKAAFHARGAGSSRFLLVLSCLASAAVTALACWCAANTRRQHPPPRPLSRGRSRSRARSLARRRMAASALLNAPSVCALAAPAPAAPARRAGPSRELYDRVAARPALLAEEPGLAAEFAAAPWHLPPRYPELDYVGVTDLLELAALRAEAVGAHARAISVLFYSSAMSEMAQNAIYTLVRWLAESAGVP